MRRRSLITALESIRRDVHAALRLFRRHPGFAAAAVLTIALGGVPLAGTFALANANDALGRLRSGALTGAAVLLP